VAVRAPVRARGHRAGRRARCQCVAERATALKARVLHARAWDLITTELQVQSSWRTSHPILAGHRNTSGIPILSDEQILGRAHQADAHMTSTQHDGKRSMPRAKLTTPAKRADLAPSVMQESGVIDPCRCPMVMPLHSGGQ